MTDLFGLVAGVGFTDVLTGQAQVEEVMQTYVMFADLQVLCAGKTAPRPTDLLSSKAMPAMLETLAEDAAPTLRAQKTRAPVSPEHETFGLEAWGRSGSSTGSTSTGH